MTRLFEQMIKRSTAALASSIGMFGQRLTGSQLIDGVVSRFVYALTRPSVIGGDGPQAAASCEGFEQTEFSAVATAAGGQVTEGGGCCTDGPSFLDSGDAIVTAGARPGMTMPVVAGLNQSEVTKEVDMDRDLRDDMLKLVRYKVLFVKREYEHAFPEEEELVSENMDGAAFAAWKVAEFIQSLARVPYEMKVPQRWGKNYPEAAYRAGTDHEWLKGLPDDDKKYLRVFYEVLDRYPREKFKYEERQIDVLEEIRDKLPYKKDAATP
ncbi:MAG: hypothetical protein AABN95_03680 [Acidobacteriota bacterium]